MKRFTGIIGVLAILSMGIAAPSLADNDVAANAHGLLLGHATPETFAAGSDHWFKAELVARRSYCLLVWAPTYDPPINIDAAWYLDDGVTGASTVYTIDIEPRITIGDNSGDSERIVPATTDVHRIRLRSSAAVAITANVMLVETTLFAPYYFVSTAAGYDSYIEMRNNTSGSLSVLGTVYTSIGGISVSFAADLPSNATTVMSLSSLGVPSGYGSVAIAHSGTPGAICANISTINLSNLLVIDTPFTPRMAWTTFGN